MNSERKKLLVNGGFTIVELIVGIVIISLLMTLGTAGYRDFTRRQAVVVGKRQLVAELRELQADALAGRKPDMCTGNLSGYWFLLSNTGGGGATAEYRTWAECAGAPGTRLDERVHTMNPGLSVAPPAENPIVFRTLTQGTDLAAVSVDIVISNSPASSNSQTITVFRNGEIR